MVEWRSPKPLIRVQFLYPLPIVNKKVEFVHTFCYDEIRAINSAGEYPLDVRKATGSNPVLPTSKKSASALFFFNH